MKKAVAYYHLSGLFEFYELYRLFLPLFRTHREYFYDWCDVGSIYGAPADCIWGGGRVGCGTCDAREVLALTREYGISARLTFSNSLLREAHLADRKCNALCRLFAQSGGPRNGVILHSELLLRYLRREYPQLYLVSSTTKVLTEFRQLRQELARSEFCYVVPDFRLNKAWAERLESAQKPQKERCDSMCYEGGIREFVRWYNRHKTPLHETVVYMAGSKGDDTAEIALQYNDSFAETIVSFANDIHTPEGGMHEEGFKRALTSVINAYGQKKGLIKGEDKVTGEDVREGLTAIISVKLTEAQFEGQTKAKLGNASMRTLVNTIVTQKLTEFLEENPAVARVILDKAMTANRAREAARKAREAIRRKTGLESGQMPDKLRDCNDTDPALTEIYIVEGDSAGGSATQGRDSRFQAILPLWGKMLNVEKARADKVYGNDKLQPVITALGAGIGDEFNLEKLRYHKVIIMADADVDGSHIRTLLLTFFFRFMRPLIERGYVYSAVPPLFKLTRGKTTKVAYSESERDQISAELRENNPNAKVDISRFKGLGEMNPHELWETTMDPRTRTLRRITLEDAVAADQIFTVLMGEAVEPRKEFIEENAKYVVNLDI